MGGKCLSGKPFIKGRDTHECGRTGWIDSAYRNFLILTSVTHRLQGEGLTTSAAELWECCMLGALNISPKNQACGVHSPAEWEDKCVTKACILQKSETEPAGDGSEI